MPSTNGANGCGAGWEVTEGIKPFPSPQITSPLYFSNQKQGFGAKIHEMSTWNSVRIEWLQAFSPNPSSISEVHSRWTTWKIGFLFPCISPPASILLWILSIKARRSQYTNLPACCTGIQLKVHYRAIWCKIPLEERFQEEYIGYEWN